MRGALQHNASTHESLVLCRQSYYYGREQQEKVASMGISSANIICTSIILLLLSVYLRR